MNRFTTFYANLAVQVTCAVCGRGVEHVEFLTDPVYHRDVIKVRCHGETERIEVSDAMRECHKAVVMVAFKEAAQCASAVAPEQPTETSSAGPSLDSAREPSAGAAFQPSDYY